jgi:hypothetical protein
MQIGRQGDICNVWVEVKAKEANHMVDRLETYRHTPFPSCHSFRPSPKYTQIHTRMCIDYVHLHRWKTATLRLQDLKDGPSREISRCRAATEKPPDLCRKMGSKCGGGRVACFQSKP